MRIITAEHHKTFSAALLNPSMFCNRAGRHAMENGPNAKNGEKAKRERHGKFAPIENVEKMAEKLRKYGKSSLSFFSVFFGHSSHSRSGRLFRVFTNVFPFFGVRSVFHCVPALHDCNPCFAKPMFCILPRASSRATLYLLPCKAKIALRGIKITLEMSILCLF